MKDSFEAKTLKKAIRAGIKAMRPDVKAATPKRIGALRFSIGQKIGGKKLKVYGLVGPRTKYKKLIKRTGRVVFPARYGHLVEFGTRRFGGRFYLRNTWRARKDKYLGAMHNVFREETRRLMAT